MATSSEAQTPPMVEGIVTLASPFSLAETLERLLATLQTHNLKVFAHIDHSAAARQVGLSMHEAHVLIFGNPVGGTPLMVAAPLLALDLPLKLLVWQAADRQVWVSKTSATYLQLRYAIPPALIGNITGVDALIEHALQP